MTTAQAQSLLETLAVEREVHATYLRFFRLVDSGELDRAAAECFTADAVVEYSILPGPSQHFDDPAAFVGFIGGMPDDDRQMVAHVAGQHLIEWEGEQPKLTGYATVWHWFR